MLTVSEAAKRTGRNPETIRRWIRAGRLPAPKVGRQLLIDEADLALVTQAPSSLAVPARLRLFESGRPQPDWGEAIHRSRRERL